MDSISPPLKYSSSPAGYQKRGEQDEQYFIIIISTYLGECVTKNFMQCHHGNYSDICLDLAKGHNGGRIIPSVFESAFFWLLVQIFKYSTINY